MLVSAFLLTCVAQAVIRILSDRFADPVGLNLGDLAFDIWERWAKRSNEGQRRHEIQTIAQQDNLRELVAQIVREQATGLPEPQQKKLAGYLNQMPSTIRQSLRRPSDPTGTTVSAGVSLRKAEDLIRFLPKGFPRFRPGERYQPRPGVAWELMEPLGVGGFGEVWKARDLPTRNIVVAIKFCLDGQAKSQLLGHEAAILKQVMESGGHKGIVRLLDQHLDYQLPALVYEYVEGGNLVAQINEWRQRKGGLAPRDSAKVIRQLAEIIGFAHSLQPPIVHRDLKPANVLVVNRGNGRYVLRITDFGIGGVAARQALDQTRTTASRQNLLPTLIAGSHSPLYASPQQIRGERPDPRDDVYALGVIWYQLLLGDVTVSRPGGNAWQKQLVTERRMPQPLLDLLVACFEEERKDRPQHAGVLATRLAACLGGTDEAIPWAVPIGRAAEKPSDLGDQLQKPLPPPSRLHNVWWFLFGSVSGVFALCGFCCLGVFGLAYLGQTTNKTYSNVHTAIEREK